MDNHSVRVALDAIAAVTNGEAVDQYLEHLPSDPDEQRAFLVVTNAQIVVEVKKAHNERRIARRDRRMLWATTGLLAFFLAALSWQAVNAEYVREAVALGGGFIGLMLSLRGALL